MVRADTSEPLESKKDTIRKKVSPIKKNVSTGIWPCKINGCNKQFAREADLKRHQKTTKLHSMPGFLCPQCDATFTRTDALRRHQKSRHNGVIIEPPDQEMKEGDEENHSLGSQSSRNGSPSAKGKERTVPSTLPVQTHQGQPIATGPSSYYRSHTMTMSSYIPQRPPYAQMGQPESSTRVNPTHTWMYPWPPPPELMVTLGYPHIPPSAMYYHPNPHYRPNGATVHPPVPPPPPIPSGTGNPPVSSRSSSSSAVPSPVSDHPPPIDGPSDIDSSLSTASQLTSEAVQSALEALVKSAQEEATTAATAASVSSSSELTDETLLDSTEFYIEPGEAPILRASSATTDEARQASLEAHADPDETSKRENGQSVVVGGGLSLEDTLNGMHGYGPPLDRPEPMEHLLTEDGEPMLNPAELLTQESLASPPPS